MPDGVNFTQTDKWTFDDIRLVLTKPSGNKTREDRYFGLQYGKNTLWLDREVGDNIDEFLEEHFIDLKKIKEDTIYDFDCKCAEGTPSYTRHGEGRCDGCHGRIWK